MISSKTAPAARHAGRVGPVHHDVRVHVAVAGVTHHADRHAVLGGDPLHAVEQLGQRGSAAPRRRR